jgi:hypothetical protein
MAKPIHLDPALLDGLPLGRDPAAVRRRIEAMEHLLERLVTIPGTNRTIGLDVILDLIPVAGQTVAAGMGAWMAWEARNLGMSKVQIARMFGNVGVDWVLGLIPFVGAIRTISSGPTPATCASSNGTSTSIIRRPHWSTSLNPYRVATC